MKGWLVLEGSLEEFMYLLPYCIEMDIKNLTFTSYIKPFHVGVCIYQKNQKISSFPFFHLTFMRENQEKEKKIQVLAFSVQVF